MRLMNQRKGVRGEIIVGGLQRNSKNATLYKIRMYET